MNPLKPVVYMTINGEKFHWGEDRNALVTNLLSFSYEDTDGTSSTNKKKKGKRDELKFSFLDFDEKTREFISDSPLFKVGSIVRFRYGFEGNMDLSPLKVMKIIKVDTTFPDGSEIATVTCHDLSKDMNQEQKDVTRPKKGREENQDKKYFLIDVISEVAEENGLSVADVDFKLGNLQLNGWQQRKETNMQFLQRLASEYGAEVYVEGKKLYFTTKKRVSKLPLWGYLHRGQDEQYKQLNQTGKRVALMLNFTPSVNLEASANSVTSEDKNSSDNKSVKNKTEKTGQTYYAVNTDTTDVNTTAQIVDGSEEQIKKSSKVKKQNVVPRSNEEAKTIDEAEQQQSNESAITASVTTLGDPRLRAKIRVRTTGRLSRKWDGARWYVESCTHVIDAGSGYTCDLKLTSPPNIDAKPDTNKVTSKKQDNKTASSYRNVNVDTTDVSEPIIKQPSKGSIVKR